MRRFAFAAAALAAGMLSGGPAAAWLAYPPDDHPDELIVEIDRQVVDVVPLRSLPKPFDAALRHSATAAKLSYRWRYSRTAEGMATLVVDDGGQASLRFGSAARPPLDGVRYGAAVVLLAEDGTPLHTFYALAAAATLTGTDAAVVRRRLELRLARPPAWWRSVAAIAVLKMSYHPLQKLDEQETWRAMRRAAWHFTGGRGTEQRG